MIVELIDKLIDCLIQLVTHQEKVRHDTFDNYVAPIFHEGSVCSQGLSRILPEVSNSY
jgi:hypothetical protein